MNNIIKGDILSNTIKDNIKIEIETNKLTPCLSVIIVGDDQASQVYVNSKTKACDYVGIKSIVYRLDNNTTQQQLNTQIKQLNNDPLIDGILLQLPLPKHLNSQVAIDVIDPNKDVDGLTDDSIAKLQNNNYHMIPCTPKGIIRLLDSINYQYKGKNAIVIGRSKLVGLPIAKLLLDKDCTVTIAHSKTNNIKELVKNYDLLICAIGQKHFIDDTSINKDMTIIDVGINRVDGKLYGDVNFDKCKDKVKYITPVPKGVGPMTIAMLLENTLIAHKRKYDKQL